MNRDKIKIEIENQFVDDYERFKGFMDSINETLDRIGIDEKYDNYNEFCVDVEESLMNIIPDVKSIDSVPVDITALAFNNVIKHKILSDKNYEKKIIEYFDDPDKIINDLNTLSDKISKL